MTRSSVRRGVVLVTVLYVSVALWALVAVGLLSATVHLRVATATRDHTVASTLALQRLDEHRALWTTPSGTLPPAGHTVGDALGQCTWGLEVVAREPELARVVATGSYRGAIARHAGTVHARAGD